MNTARRTSTFPDGTERVVILRYLPAYLRDLGFQIDIEVFAGGNWTTKSRFPTDSPDSLDRTVERAKHYVAWLNSVD